jgi:broad specificity phosphatase PhoE
MPERAMRTRLRRLSLIAPLLLGALPLMAQDAGRTVVVVRHAEKGAEGTDPSLTPAGVGRAEALSRALQDVKVSALFATEYKRTQETVRALEQRLGVGVTVVPARAVDSLVARIQALPPGAAAVVASHSNLVHVIVQRLSGVTIPELTEADYDRMAVVTMTGPGKGTVLVLRYGAPSAAGPQAPMVKP